MTDDSTTDEVVAQNTNLYNLNDIAPAATAVGALNSSLINQRRRSQYSPAPTELHFEFNRRASCAIDTTDGSLNVDNISRQTSKTSTTSSMVRPSNILHLWCYNINRILCSLLLFTSWCCLD